LQAYFIRKLSGNSWFSKYGYKNYQARNLWKTNQKFWRF